MSEKNQNLKRNASDEEASSVSVKKTKLDDSTTDSHVVVFVSSSSTDDSASVTDEQSSSISSVSLTTESNVKNNPSFVTDLEDHQNSETETDSTFVRVNEEEALGEIKETESLSATKVKVKKKTPTEEEIAGFFSEIEKGDDKQKRFMEKYNFDIVNDKPLEGRYKWDRIEQDEEQVKR